MSRGLLISLLLFCTMELSISQDTPLIAAIKNSDNITITKTHSFDGNSLWGYMNGGADLYLEYDFQSLTVHDLEVNGNEIKLELFSMSNPLMARAIFAIRSNGLLGEEYIRPWSFNPYQVQLALGNTYVSIINYNGSDDALKACLQISNLVVSGIAEDSTQVPGFIKNGEGRWYYFKGKLGATNCGGYLTKLLASFQNYEVWLNKGLEEDKLEAFIFIDDNEKEQFLHKLIGSQQYSWKDYNSFIKLSWTDKKPGEHGWQSW